ncbi:hypothetical protein TSAR_000455, partial [Trichomalopsis sarcophagae]
MDDYRLYKYYRSTGFGWKSLVYNYLLTDRYFRTLFHFGPRCGAITAITSFLVLLVLTYTITVSILHKLVLINTFSPYKTSIDERERPYRIRALQQRYTRQVHLSAARARKEPRKKERTADTHIFNSPVRSKEKTGSNLALINPRHTWRGRAAGALKSRLNALNIGWLIYDGFTHKSWTIFLLNTKKFNELRHEAEKKLPRKESVLQVRPAYNCINKHLQQADVFLDKTKKVV